MGLDRNLLKAVELAHGEYCWLMGNDDKIEPHAISGILKRIEEYGKPTVLNVKGYLYDRDMKTKQLSQIRVGLRKSVLQQDTMFENIDEIVKLFGDSFGFLGDNLFRRDIWNEVVANTDLAPYYTCCYIHLAVLLMMLQKSPKFLYINQHCVGFRGNNDLFLEILGELRRLKLDVVGYDQVAAGVFSRKSHLYKAWMTRVMQFHIRSRVLAIKFNANSSQMSEVAELMFKYYKTLPGFWIHILPILLLPRNILLGLRACYRATIRRATPQI
jgi:abequosyltransferase